LAKQLPSLQGQVVGESIRRIHQKTARAVYLRRPSSSGAGISPGTINRDLAVARRILNPPARLWRDESDRPWLDELDTSVFVVPRAFVKNGLDRFVVLNRVANLSLFPARNQLFSTTNLATVFSSAL
jgi:hypothetical protein